MALYYKITFNEEFGLDNVPNDAEPYLSGATLNECTSMNNWLTLGGSASNRLKFNVKNAPVNNFEGARIALYIKDEPTPGADDASDIAITIDNESTFLEDVEQIEELPLNDPAEDVDIENIEDIPGTVTDYELEPIIDESGDNDEIVENDNYRNESFDIQGEAAADIEPVTDLIKMGEFIITQVTQSNDETLSITALDLLSLLNVTPELTTTTGYAQVIFDELKTQAEALDLVVNDLELPQMSITVPPLKTVRDLFGLFASLNGAYVCCDRNGVIDFRPYLKNDVYINYNEVKTFSTLCESTVNINSIACDISTSLIERNFIISGDDEEPEMIINNPWINQTILDSILSLYQYTIYQPANIVCNWNYQIETGDFIQIESAQGNPVWVCVTNQTISLDSGLTQIESRGESYELNAISKEKPVDAKFKTLYSEMIEAKYIDADKVVADGLEANKADITDLVTDNLTVGSINGNVIQNGTVLAAALSQEAVQTIGGNKVYYQAEAPTGGIYVNGDTWYKTVIADTDTDKKVLHVWNGSTWEATDFDARILRVNTITSQEIAANTIEAGNINMDNLQTNLARIGATDGKHIEIDNESVTVANGNKDIISFGSITEEGHTYSNIKSSEDSNIIINANPMADYNSQISIIGSKSDTLGKSRSIMIDTESKDGRSYANRYSNEFMHGSKTESSRAINADTQLLTISEENVLPNDDEQYIAEINLRSGRTSTTEGNKFASIKATYEAETEATEINIDADTVKVNDIEIPQQISKLELTVSTHTGTTGTIASGAMGEGSYTATKAGWYPLGIVGYGTANGSGSGSSYAIVNIFRMTGRTTGSCTINWRIRAYGGQVKTNTLNADILWMRTV